MYQHLLDESKQNPRFTHLDLSCYEIDDIQTIMEELQHTHVTHLNLKCNGITDEDMIWLALLLPHTQITSLHIPENNIGDRGALALAHSLTNSKITHLDLEGNNIGDIGTVSLIQYAQNTPLQYLDLTRNNITDIAAHKISKLLKKTNIMHLDLSGNKIYAAAAHALIQGVSASQIIDMSLENNMISDESVNDALNEALSVNDIITSTLRDKFFKLVSYNSIDEILVFNQRPYEQMLTQYADLITSIKLLPSITSHLIDHEKELTYDKIVEFIKNISFRFVEFITSHPNYEQTDYINALNTCENNNLTEVVKHLLLHRPLFEIEQSEYDGTILHPYVYVLLAKYKQPLIYTALESNEYTQHVVEYFNNHPELDHVQEAITLLGDLENV